MNDAVINWVTSSKNFKCVVIHYTCAGGTMDVFGGRDAGVRLAETLDTRTMVIETLSNSLFETYGFGGISQCE